MCPKCLRNLSPETLSKLVLLGVAMLLLIFAWGAFRYRGFLRFKLGHQMDPISDVMVAKILKMASVADRVEIFGTIAHMPDSDKKSLANKLTWYLRDPSDQVRIGVTLALCMIGPPGSAAVPGLTRLVIGDPSVVVRIQAASALGTMGPDAKEAIPALKNALDNPINPYKLQIASALQLIDKEGVDTTRRMNQMMTDPQAGVRSIGYAAASLSSGTPANSLAAVLTGLRDHNRSVQNSAAKMAEKMGPAAKPAVPLLIPLLKDPSMVIQVASTLRAIGPGAASATEPLIDALMRPGWGKADDVVKSVVAEALGYLGPEARKAIPALEKCLHSSRLVRSAAVVSLARMGQTTPEVIHGLRALFTDPTVIGLRLNLVAAGEDGIVWGLKFQALMALRYLSPDSPDVLPLWQLCLRDPSPRLRLQAIIVLAQTIPDKQKVTSELLQALKNPDKDIRHFAKIELDGLNQARP